MGSSAYLTVTKLDIALVVHVVNQFVTAPSTIRSSYFEIYSFYQFHSPVFPFTSFIELPAYSDADWDNNAYDYKSTNRYCIFLVDSLSL